MLIPSPRFKPGDLEAWDQLERYDHKLGGTLRAQHQEAEALRTLEQWMTEHPDGSVSTSWGKDSTVVCDLATRVNPNITIKRARVADWEPPETDWVRDAFLQTHPHVNYIEVLYQGRIPQRGEPGFEEIHADPNRKATNIQKKLIPGRYISGVRAEEARIRAQSLRWHGVSTDYTSRPIIKWTGVDVFAYLAAHDLPVHPTYAMTYSGLLDRRWLRVHILGSTKAKRSAVYGRSMDEWEDDYYGDVLTSARTAREHLWT